MKGPTYITHNLVLKYVMKFDNMVESGVCQIIVVNIYSMSMWHDGLLLECSSSFHI